MIWCGQRLGPLAVVLRDYKLENMTMMQTATGWQVTGVFDLMEAAVGHPESDSVRQALAYLDAGQPMAARQFVRATMGEAVDWQGWQARWPLFVLADRVLIWEWRQRQRPAQSPSLRQFVEPYLAFQS